MSSEESAAAPVPESPSPAFPKVAVDLEIPQLLALVEDYCSCAAGRLELPRRPLASPGDARDEQDRIWSCRQARSQVGSFSFHCDAPLELVTRCRIPGMALSVEDLVLVWDAARAADEARRQVDEDRTHWERFGAEVDALPDLPGFRASCKRTFDARGGILDNATPRLASLRRRKKELVRSIEEELSRIMRGKSKQYLSDEFVTQRDGRWVVPLKANQKGRIEGVVVSSSKTGATLYVEPYPVIKLSNEMRGAEADEAAEVHAILQGLTRQLAEHDQELEMLIRGLAELDSLHARAAFADRYECHEVAFSEHGGLDLRRARHLLLGEDVVPIDLRLPEETRVLVLSGANAGGKTVALKTLGTITYLAACGYHVPVEEGSTTTFPGNFFCIIGDEQSLEHNLSSFSSHVRSTAAVIREARAGDLVLLDELMSGTDPEEGSALALELLYALGKRGALTVITTHYSLLKTAAREEPHFENASVEFDEEAFRPTFTILPSTAGPSRGFEIACRFGIPEALVEKARLRLGPERARLEEMLRGVESDRLDMALARQKAEGLKAELEEQQRELVALRKELKEKVYQEAQERAQELDEELTRLRKLVLEALEEGRVADAARLVESSARGREELPEPPPKEGWETLSVGDRVRVGGYGVVGVILDLDLHKKRARVDTGSMQVEVDLTRCEEEAAPPPPPKKKPKRRGQTKTPVPKKDPSAMVLTEVHLIGMRALEAQEKLETEIDLAISLNADGVRVIHGFGTGTLKAMTWEILKNHDLVREIRPGGEYEGGRGATIAVFR